MIRVGLEDGSSYVCTPNHRFFLADDRRAIEVRNLFLGAFLLGNVGSLGGGDAIEVVSLSKEPNSPSYCFNVETTHSFDLPTVHSGNCGEILLPDKGFCNLVEVNLSAFGRDMGSLLRATYLMGRANYRQTCVDFRDGVLSPQWHQTNEALRLCGVGMTGIAQATHLTDYDLRALRDAAVTGAHSMADELGLPRSKAVTTIKPSGTLSKVMDCTEGIHRPIGRYIFNWIGYSIHDPLVPVLERSGYKVLAHPVDPAACLICFPVSWPTVPFDSVDGKPVNLESAISQLERYARWMRLYVDHNASCTISYSPSELPAIASWLHSHWNTGDFVAVSFAKRLDPTMTAASYGVNYLPQEVVDPSTFTSYESSLRPVDWSYSDTGVYDLLDAPDCSSGACPVR